MQPSRRIVIWQLSLAALLSLGLTYFVLRGGWSLGFFLAVLLTEGTFLAWLRMPSETAASSSPVVKQPGPAFSRSLQSILALIVTDLSLCFLLYDNILLRVLNTLVILVLLALQFMIGSRIFLHEWDEPEFWIEAAVSCIARPWVCLVDFGRHLGQLASRRAPAASTANTESEPALNAPSNHQAHGLLVRILLGLLLAIPVLLIAGSLLASADVVFAQLFANFKDVLTQLSLSELFKIILTAAVLLPFIFSFMYSGFKHWRLLPDPVANQPKTKGFRLDKIVLISFLTCINLLYLLFAIIQMTYLTGAIAARLPENMTYAEYARSGFFELAAISAVNLALILVAVKSSDRQGLAGRILRGESLLLVAGSLVQWTSAMFRMNLYINTYGLTQLRFLVTAFMLLLLALFALLLTKEFRPGFPLFKAFAAVTLASLLLLNHVNSDAWIAGYNTQRYAATGKIDTNYFKELSHSAVPAMLQLTESAEPAIASEIAAQLLRRYAGSLEHDSKWRWQRLNVSDEQALTRIAADLDRLKQLNPIAANAMDGWRTERED